MPVDKLDRYRGCLLGGAAGDALGYPVEFLSLDGIREQYGPAGITEYKLQRGVAQISDDTQMTLFTANGLLVGQTRGCLRGIMGPYTDYVAQAYQEWYKTQVCDFPATEDSIPVGCCTYPACMSDMPLEHLHGGHCGRSRGKHRATDQQQQGLRRRYAGRAGGVVSGQFLGWRAWRRIWWLRT